jgi:hypothetical protein
LADFPKLAEKLSVIRTDRHENLVRPKNDFFKFFIVAGRLGSNNIKLCGLKVHLNTKKKKCTRTEIPINLSFYVFIKKNLKS